jgi:hypothetical protein
VERRGVNVRCWNHKTNELAAERLGL